MGRSRSLETGSSAEHTLYGPWRNIVGAQQEPCTVAFDLANFVIPNPLK